VTETAHRLSLGERVADLARLPHRPGVGPSPVASSTHAPEEHDVVVVGSGAAALSAAAGALGTGASVVVCEKGPVPGGTTACSGGVAHIYANSVMQAAGIADPRDQALAYMARVSHPGAYDPEAPGYGLLPADFALLETYYDRGAEVMARLGDLDAVHMAAPWMSWDAQLFPDYYEFPENLAVRGRGIQTVAPDGGAGNGGELVRQLMAFAAGRGTEVRLGHRVVDLTLEDGEVTGVVVDDGSACRRIRAHGGVVFGSGGFAHSPELRERFLRGPIAGGSGTPSNTGDLVGIGTRAGAVFGGMHNGWWNQQVLEAVDDYAASVLDVWSVPGDGMLMVNRLGLRAIGEKREYESRGRVHHIFAGDEYVNRVMFMVYDHRTAERYGGRYPIPPVGTVADHVVTGTGVLGLAQALGTRLVQLKSSMPAGIAPVALDPNFADTLADAIARFNDAAERGHDDEFGRGTKAVEFAFHGPRAADNSLPNPLMHPLDVNGPLHAISLVGTTFDTNSGPRVGTEGQILGTAGPIGGLYGAGNCVNSVFGEGYPGGGSTIGPGMVFGFLAGAHAGRRSPRVGSGR
jgi:succinate dehydrogenase/fumarate reductase flavoprotein subunit